MVNETAWTPLDPDEYKRAWDGFYDTFAFTPSVRPESFPGIEEPVPSVTYDLSPIFSAGPETFARAEGSVRDTVLRGLRAITATDQPLVALDWQHPCYWFRPHVLDRPEDPDEWRIPVFPNGDYYIFPTTTMDQGVVGHPWEQTLCIWGPELLRIIDDERCPELGHVSRRDGQPPR